LEFPSVNTAFFPWCHSEISQLKGMQKANLQTEAHRTSTGREATFVCYSNDTWQGWTEKCLLENLSPHYPKQRMGSFHDQPLHTPNANDPAEQKPYWEGSDCEGLVLSPAVHSPAQLARPGMEKQHCC
jgi:hypothetical protein